MSDSPLLRLKALGQCVWLDYLDRDLVRSGRLQGMVEEAGVSGITSNPAIFEKAILHTEHYDAEISAFAASGLSSGEICEELVVADIRSAADVLLPVYESSGRSDGFVSLELSPHLVDDEMATIAEARRLRDLVDRPNLLLKVPATDPGIAALRTLVGEGIGINVTLLFSLERYRDVVDAYLEGLEDAREAGLSLKRITSVASFFLSRIDTAVDGLLEPMVVEGGSSGRKAKWLKGEIAIASARRAYAIYQKMHRSRRYRDLQRHGARTQRLLWASTGTKNPAYSDVRYVDSLIGPETINTMPPGTLQAYQDHGDPAPRLMEGMDRAAKVLKELGALGIDLDDVCRKLLSDGVRKFVEPYDALHEAIAARQPSR